MADDAKKLVVIGAGPGGYPAAFRAAELGFDVTLIDPRPQPGGVCLYEGCIPSKALLHVARALHEAEAMADWGIQYSKPRIDIDRLRTRVGDTIETLTRGLGGLAKRHKVKHVRGHASFKDKQAIDVTQDGSEGDAIEFDFAIIATGSRAAEIPGVDTSRSAVWDARTALEIKEIPDTLLVIGAGYIGLEMGTIYAALGSRVTVVEMTDTILPGADPDLTKPLFEKLSSKEAPGHFEEILLNSKVMDLRPYERGMEVEISNAQGKTNTRKFSKVLLAAGRLPNSEDLGLDELGIETTDTGHIQADSRQRTNRSNIFAIGDVAGEPMLAHKASHQGRVAAEVAAGRPSAFDAAAVPAVVFTNPEIAWAGLTETEARSEGIEVNVVRFPWSASGKATAVGKTEGLTKLIVEPRTERLVGIGIVGAGAGDLIAEGTLAIEMGAQVEDLALTIHPHPTLSETIMEAADVFYGKSAHYLPQPSRGDGKSSDKKKEKEDA